MTTKAAEAKKAETARLLAIEKGAREARAILNEIGNGSKRRARAKLDEVLEQDDTEETT